MPNPPTPNMGMVLPIEGSDTDVWGMYLNSALGTIVDQHDHSPGKGPRIPSAALKINADVSWASSGVNYSITDAKALDFTPQAPASVTGYASALFVSSADNNLYFRNSIGTNVQITSGSTINVSIVGGIGGDYASVGALVDYDDATDTYRMRQETSSLVRQYAKVATADLVLREYRAAGNPTVPVNTVTVKSPTALAASYSVTLPSALPSKTSPLTMSSAGVVIADDTTHSLHVSGAQAIQTSASHTILRSGYLLAASVVALYYPINLKDGDQIIGFKLYCDKRTAGTDTISAQLVKVDDSAASITNIGSGASNNANAPGFIVLQETIASPETVVTGPTWYQLAFTPGGATAASHRVFHLEVLYKRA